MSRLRDARRTGSSGAANNDRPWGEEGVPDAQGMGRDRRRGARFRPARTRRSPAAGGKGVEPSRGAGDQRGSGRGQHGRVCVREPRPSGQRHARGELHPAGGAGRRAELRQVRRRRPLRAPRRQRRRRARGHRPTSSGSRRSRGTRTRSSTTPARSRRSRTTGLEHPPDLLRHPRRRRRRTHGARLRPARRRRSTSARARRRTTTRSRQAAVNDLPGGIKVFAGQRDDPFFVDLGSVFDLAGLRPFNPVHIIPLAGRRRRRRRRRLQHAHDRDPGADVDTSCTAFGEPTIGVYASASRQRDQRSCAATARGTRAVRWSQVSRLATRS